MPLKECKNCNSSFQTVNLKQSFCSKRCVGISRRKRVMRQCQRCKQVFETNVGVRIGKFCSHSCRALFYSCERYGIEQIKPEKREISWSKEIAYLIGIIASDGTLRKNRDTIRIASKDIEMLENVKIIVCDFITGRENNFCKEIKKCNGKEYVWWSFQFSSKLFYNFCLEIGLMPNKTLILSNLHIPDVFFGHFLRGFIDGDGNYNILRRQNKEGRVNHVHIRITSGSHSFLEWLRIRCHQLFKTGNGTILDLCSERGSKYILFWSNAQDVTKIIRNIYIDADFFLTRKKQRILELLIET